MEDNAMKNDPEQLFIDHQEVKVQPIFGGKKVVVTYEMLHRKHGRDNKYLVTCSIQGLADADIHLSVDSAVFMGNEDETNDETLMEDNAKMLFEEKFL
jgi:c-di-GMP-related signal transduction protein